MANPLGTINRYERALSTLETAPWSKNLELKGDWEELARLASNMLHKGLTSTYDRALHRLLDKADKTETRDPLLDATIHTCLAQWYEHWEGGPFRSMIAIHARHALAIVKGKEREDDEGAIYALATLLLVEHWIPDEGTADPVGLLNIMIRLGMYDTPSRIEAHVSGNPEVHKGLLALLIERADSGEPHAFSPSGLAKARAKLAELSAT